MRILSTAVCAVLRAVAKKRFIQVSRTNEDGANPSVTAQGLAIPWEYFGNAGCALITKDTNGET
jgi:hypothetical protein